MFTTASREALRDRLVQHARSSPAITAAALVGSAAAGTEDAWSDIDLALRLAPGADQGEVADAWTAWLEQQTGVAHHLDVRTGATLFRVLLLPDSLQVDLSFWHPDDFRAESGPFCLLFGTAGAPAPTRGLDPEHLIGMAWLHALHVRSALARDRPWQASTMLDGLREQLVALACLRAGLPPHQGRGTDRLAPQLLDALATTRPAAMQVAAITRAFTAAAALLLEQAAAVDPSLAERLRDPLVLLVQPRDAGSGPSPTPSPMPMPMPMPMPSNLSTARLRLRPFGPPDAQWLHDLWAERDPRSLRRLDADGRPTVADLRADLLARLRRGGPALLVAEVVAAADGADGAEGAEGADVIGYCGLIVGQASAAEPELAFELFRRAHGKGYATEAARAVVDAADAAGYPRLWSTVREWNAPSLRVLAKLGFVRSGRVDPDPERGDSIWLVRSAGDGEPQLRVSR